MEDGSGEKALRSRAQLLSVLLFFALPLTLVCVSGAAAAPSIDAAAKAQLLLRSIEFGDMDLRPLKRDLPSVFRVGLNRYDWLEFHEVGLVDDPLPSRESRSTRYFILDALLVRLGDRIRLDYTITSADDPARSRRGYVVFSNTGTLRSLGALCERIAEDVQAMTEPEPRAIILAVEGQLESQGVDPYELAVLIPSAIALDLRDFVDRDLEGVLLEVKAPKAEESDFLVSGRYLQSGGKLTLEISVKDRSGYTVPIDVSGTMPFDLIEEVLRRIGEVVEARTTREGQLRELPSFASDADSGQLVWEARTLLEQRREEEAVLLLRLAVRKDPGSAEPRIELGDLFFRRREFDQALAEYVAASVLEPRNALSLLGEARSLRELRRFEEAVEKYASALDLADMEPELRHDANLGIAKIKSLVRKPEEAIPYYQEALRLDRDDVNVIRGLSDSYLEVGKEQEAIEVLQAALQYTANLEEVDDLLAELHLRSARDRLREEDYVKALNLSLSIAQNENVEQTLRANAYEIAAEAAIANRSAPRVEDAITYLRHAARLDESNLEAWSFLGRLYEEEKRYPEALESVNQALRLKPEVGLYVQRARLYRRMGQLDLAIRSVLSARSRDPLAASAGIELAEIYERQGRYDNAIQELDSVLQRNPQNPIALDMRRDVIAEKRRHAVIGKHLVPPGEDSPVLDRNVWSGEELYDRDFQNARITNSEMVETRLGYSDFTKASLERVNLTKAELSNAKFRESRLKLGTLTRARLVETEFSNAWLCRSNLANTEGRSAIFERAILRDVQFDDADLTSASFRGAALKDTSFKDAELYKTDFSGVSFKALNLEGTAWWLARGWSPKQLRRLRRQFPPEKYLQSTSYKDLIKEKEKDVRAARSHAERAEALNNLAWTRTIRAGDLKKALVESTEALKLVGGKDPAKLDTRAQIYLQMNDFDKARADLDKAFGIRPGTVPDPKDLKRPALVLMPFLFYRYALVLDYQGQDSQAHQLYRTALDSGYEPYHEQLTKPPRSLPEDLKPLENPDRDKKQSSEFSDWCTRS